MRKIKICRICGGSLHEQPLLIFENMPSKAQFLPTKNVLEYDKGIVLKINQCQFCGVVQLENQPVKYYKSVIRASGISEEMKQFRKQQFKNSVQRFSLSGKKIIETGCGAGEFLSIMSETGVKVFGIEYQKELVEKCIENGFKVIKGFIGKSNCKLKYSPFDGFYTLSFLEHLPDPNSTLKGIYNNLTDEAVGIVEVPNFDMMMKKKLFSEFMVDHLFYFTKDTLRTTLNINGFEVLECKEIWYDYIISAIVRKRKKLDLTSMYKQEKKIKKELWTYLNRFKGKKIALWGAGHQAFAILALAGVLSKIKYVVDSAPFKQGRYTPVTHIPIVSPETINSDPVDAIIIMAGSYSDEVSKIIREKFSKDINVAILRDFGLEEVKNG